MTFSLGMILAVFMIGVLMLLVEIFVTGFGIFGVLGIGALGRIMLQENQHDRGQRNHPKEVVAELGAGRDIGGPIPGINETYGYQQARSQIL